MQEERVVLPRHVYNLYRPGANGADHEVGLIPLFFGSPKPIPENVVIGYMP